MQVSKQRSECILAFAQINPLYMSPNAKEGKIECAKFFPEGYDTEDEEEEEEEEEGEEEGESKLEGMKGLLCKRFLKLIIFVFKGGELLEEDEAKAELSEKPEGDTNESNAVLPSGSAVRSEVITTESGAEISGSMPKLPEEPSG